jgi:N-acetylmuramoyl-L-alanine amidase
MSPLTEPDCRLVDALHPSPNIEPRQRGLKPDLIVLHYTGMATAAKAIDWLSRPESKVSAHYVVDVDGTTTQLVAEGHRAWHAGVSVWAGETDINSLSIGIEIQNPGHEDGYPDFTTRQMRRVADLCLDIARRHAVPPQRILAHSDIAPGRKIDPGEKFDWAWLASEGVGHWVEPAPLSATAGGMSGADVLGPGSADSDVALVQGLLRDYGYGCEDNGLLDPATVTVIRGFQRHFRPARIDGCIDRSTLLTLERLIAALPRPLTV